MLPIGDTVDQEHRFAVNTCLVLLTPPTKMKNTKENLIAGIGLRNVKFCDLDKKKREGQTGAVVIFADYRPRGPWFET